MPPSHWDRLPIELRDMVIDAGDELTRLSAGRLPRWQLRAASRQTAARLWELAVSSEWQGDLRLLPPSDSAAAVVEAVRSRAMYRRLRALGGQHAGVVEHRWTRALARCAVGNSWADELAGFPPRLLVEAAARTGDVRLLHELVVERQAAGVFPKHVYVAARAGQLEVLQWIQETGQPAGMWRPWPRNAKVHEVAAMCGHVHVMDWLHAQGLGGRYSESCLRFAGSHGYSDVIRRVLELQPETNVVMVLTNALASGHADLATWLFHRLPTHHRLPRVTLSAAARVNHTFILNQGLSREQYVLSPSLPLTAAAAGWRDLVERLHKMDPAADWMAGALDRAAAEGHLAVVEFLHANRPEGCTQEAMDEAAVGGHLDVVMFLDRHRREGCTTAAMDGAAANGHLAIVKYLHEFRAEGCTTEAMDGAATNGQLAMVRWLHAHRAEGCTTKAVDGAAANGHLDVVQWLLNHRAEGGTQNGMDGAVVGGHVEVAQVLFGKFGQRARARATTKAAQHGHFEMVRWLDESGAGEFTNSTMDEAAASGWVRIVAYLSEHRAEGCTTAAMDRAAGGGHLDVVEYLHANRREGATYAAMDAAARAGYLEVVEFLHERRDEGCSEEAADGAVERGHLDVVRFLGQHRSEGCSLRSREMLVRAGWDGLAQAMRLAE
ncbi:hypothetical protein HK105_205695 [Polyrhizophydium stewartii]|uniref:Ankyrin repeat domain containing protein n=1 Tax=Polyrhizophydium stewartii TaxID=2732419 RepID=A0ABR4N5M7_9FUNG